jgi:hypothetical protein
LCSARYQYQPNTSHPRITEAIYFSMLGLDKESFSYYQLYQTHPGYVTKLVGDAHPIKIFLISKNTENGYLIQVIDKKNIITQSITTDNTVTIDTINYLRILADGGVLQIIHPIEKKEIYTPKFLDFITHKIDIQLSCWCADETYPEEQDLSLVYLHFVDLKEHYIKNVDVVSRRKAIEGRSRALYSLVAVASSSVNESRKLHKSQVSQMKKEMGKIIGDLYVDQSLSY